MDLQGPLSQIWIASNYEKKLTKQQFLNTNLIESSKLLDNSITLRLSGQLLLGIVRIYSRKTKYLLDDVQDILYKLKHSFKISTGSTFENNVSSKNIININQVILADQITDHDLLYQPDFNFEDTLDPILSISQPSSQRNLLSPTNINNERISQISQDSRQRLNEGQLQADLSIEYGRDEEFDNHLEFDDLNFDLGNESVEVGRDVELPVQEQSLLDIGNKSTIDQQPTSPQQLPSLEVTEPQQLPLPSPAEIQPPKEKVKKVGLMENGIKTNKRKLQIDEELTMSIDDLNSFKNLQLTGNWRDQFVTFKLNNIEKIELINELCGKRMKLNINNELLSLSNTLAQQEKDQVDQPSDHEIERDEEDQTQDIDRFDDDINDTSNDFSNDFAFDYNFDVSINEPSPIDLQLDKTESTKQIINILKDNPTCSFNKIIENDLKNQVPLGAVNKDSVNMKREASKCFFELLVLATKDSISLNQENQETEIGGEINISTKPKIFDF